MKVGIVQPNYIPWRGYFDFIDDVDLFVFYDDVAYTRRDWRNRNKIKTQQGTAWLSVPVTFHQPDQQLICESRIDETHPWRDKHINLIQQNYRQAPFFDVYCEEFFEQLNRPAETIADLDVRLTLWLMAKLEIDTPVQLSSELEVEGTKTDRLINVLQKVGATSYLSGPAAKSYIEREKFEKASIALEYKMYNYDSYPQLWGNFEGAVTVLDLLFNCGENSSRHLKSKQDNESA